MVRNATYSDSVVPNAVDAPPAKPAATVVAVGNDGGVPKVLLLRRNDTLRIMPGLWVFPGGKVDAHDSPTGELHPEMAPAAMEASARVAAVRELEEEAALAIDVERLVPFSHWLTPLEVKHRFATWFYLAMVSDTQCPSVTVCGSEIVDHRWLGADEALALNSRGELPMSPPTCVSLHGVVEIFSQRDPLEALAWLRGREPWYFFPRLKRSGTDACFLYAGDAAYESLAVDAPGARHRTWSRDGRFSYERSFNWPTQRHD